MDPEEDTKELSLIERLKAKRLKAEGGQQNSAEEVDFFGSMSGVVIRSASA